MLFQFLDETMPLHEKIRKSSAAKRTDELIQVRSEGRSKNSHFIKHCVYRVIQRKLNHISCLRDILLMYYLEVIWHIYPFHTNPNWFFSHIQKWNFMSQFFLQILDLNFATWSVESILGNDSRTGILTNRKLGVEAKCYNSPFRPLLGKLIEKVSKKI